MVSYCNEFEVDILADHKDLLEGIEDTFGKAGTYPADYLYVYDEPAAAGEDGDQVKQETADAYNKVGGTAHIKGNLKKAEAVMTRLGYNPEEIKVAGEDGCNYQGVGCPHRFAKIQPGEKVLDLGSGLGIDSFIANHYAGPTGKVVGLDISKTEVKHAEARAAARGIPDSLKFVVADMEQNPLPDNSIDVVISNGAFCLAPNKAKAFSEIYRVLKPGGRMAVCTSTIKMALEPGVTWPICMRMFVHIDAIAPTCEEIGFQNIVVDSSDDKMTFEIEGFEDDKQPEETDAQKKERMKNQVHVGSAEFKHLENFDMNAICARVTVLATKPAETKA